MTEEYRITALPKGVVAEDRQLERAAESATEALAYHRWHWTLDESNPDRVSIRQYAEAVDKAMQTIQVHVKGYMLSAQSDRDIPVTEGVERARMSAERELASDAVAQAHGIKLSTVRLLHKDEVKEVQSAVQREAERREEHAEDFPADAREDYAKRLAEMKKRTQEREEREEEQYKQNHGWAFFDIDTDMSKARELMRTALTKVKDVQFDDEERELLQRENEAIRGMSRLIESALTGDSGTDWDAELALLEERREYGS